MPLSRDSYPSKYPIDDSNKKSEDPGLHVLEKTSNHRSEQYVDGPIVLATEYKFTVQTNVKPFNPAHTPMQFTLGQQRRTSLPISEPKEKPVILGANKKDQYSSPLRDGKFNVPTKVENKHTIQTKVEPSNPAHGPTQFMPGQQRRSSLPISEPIVKPVLGPNKKDQYSSPIRNDKFNLPTEVEMHTVQTKVGPSNNKKENPPFPIHDQTCNLPTKNHKVVDEKQDKPPTLARDYRYKSPIIEEVETKNNKPLDNKRGKATYPGDDYPEQVEEFISNVHTEVSRPTKPGLVSGKNWRNIGRHQYLDKPNANTGRFEQYVEPYTVGKTWWEGPNRREWALPPTQATPLFGATNDIGEALNTLKGAVQSPPPPRNNFNYMDSKNLIRDTNAGAIDSREAQRRYGKPNPTARPSVNYYTGTITSTEAAEKYGGSPV